MRIFKDISEIKWHNQSKPLTIALGNFDGVHLGHQKLIKITNDISCNLSGETLVLTFYPPPQLVFNPDFKMISTLEFKTKFMEALGIDNFLAIPFTKEFSKLQPEVFIEEILHKKINASNIVCGYNYSFGHNGMGKTKDLIRISNTLDMTVNVMEPFYVENQVVSSTKIRELISLGKLKTASRFLGYYPRLKGKVIQGNQIGRKIGFPTANLLWDSQIITPPTGVYAVEVIIGSQLKKGVLNIGYKPTVTNTKSLTIEVNIFDFSEDIYSHEIELVLHKKLRNEVAFSNLDQLKEQIVLDVVHSKKYFSQNI